MTTIQLAAGYYRKCSDRMAALEVLLAREAWSDVIRESQEVVELALKGLLRAVGVDPPKWHDVGGLLLDHAQRISVISEDELRYLAKASKRLRKEREFSFYGEIDFIPTDEYDEDDASWAFESARRASNALGILLEALQETS
jgi:HEPN domain-containing protein